MSAAVEMRFVMVWVTRSAMKPRRERYEWPGQHVLQLGVRLLEPM